MEIELFSPHIGQRRVIEGFADSVHKFCIVSCGRQYGKSLLGMNLMLYWLLKEPNAKGSWISPVYSQCKKVFDEMTTTCHELIDKQNRSDLTIDFVNGSSIKFLSTDNYNSIRGFSFHYMVIDEAAFSKEEAINEAVLPTLTALGKKCLIISTPRSKNWFYQWYLKGKESSDNYISYEGISEENPFTDKNFLHEQQKSLPPDIYRQEYLGEFTDSTADVFRNVSLACIRTQWSDGTGQKTFFGIDTGLSSDFSVLTVISETGQVLFIDRINNLPVQDIAARFSQVLKRYKPVGGYVETNGIGKSMYDLVREQTKVAREFITTNESKTQGVRKLILDMEEGVLELPSKELFPPLYNELNAYSYKITANGAITFNGVGTNDDTVMSLMLANEARSKIVSSAKSFYVGGGVQKKRQYI